jgi:DNA-binding IclR family transcriptional regulator
LSSGGVGQSRPNHRAHVGRIATVDHDGARRHRAIHELLDLELRDDDRFRFEEVLADVRIRGLSRTEGEEQATINALSAPLFDSQGDIAGALTLLGPERHFSVDWDGRLARELLAVSKVVSQRLGYKEAS